MVRGLTAAAALCALLAGAAWHFYIEPGLLFEQARYAHMERLVGAVAEYNTRHGRLPTSLRQLVAAGVLPADGEMYYSPVRHRSRRVRRLAYTECEYSLSFEPEQVTVAIPEVDYQGSRFYLLGPADYASRRVTRQMKVYRPE